MAGGPFFPHSPIPVTAAGVFPSVHVGAGANSKHDYGLGFAASLAADSTWRLRFLMPPTLPSGTAKLVGYCLANATSGAAQLNAKWASVAVGEDPSSATLHAEGTTTLTWAEGDNDDYKLFSVTLDADTVVASEIIVMDLVGQTTGWTLAQVLTITGLGVIFE